MRLVVVGLLCVSSAVRAAPLGFDDARQLLARTGFGPTDAQVRKVAKLSRAEAVEQILAGLRTEPSVAPPAWVNGPLEKGGGLKDAPLAVRHAVRAERRDEAIELSAWWLREMLTTPSPLTEKMVLFWHNHFVSSVRKVRSSVLMYRQNALFRKHALGNFRTLLHEVARDPAMVVYLDSVANKKGQPNENFAREVMELFTLGEGHYTETDVKEAARAFTGFGLERADGTYRFRPRLHDDGDKTVLGLQGNLDGDRVLDQLLEQPSCAPFLVRKLWRAFVSPTPDEAEVTRLAKRLRDGNWELRPVMRALLLSNAFYAGRGTLVKSPVELIVGTLRQLDDTPDVPPADLLGVVATAAQLGQALFAPPNVKGWPGGNAFIDANTLLLRKQFLSRIAQEPETGRVTHEADSGIDLASFAKTLPGSDADRIREATRLLLPLPPLEPVPGETPVVALRALLLDPVYQLE